MTGFVAVGPDNLQFGRTELFDLGGRRRLQIRAHTLFDFENGRLKTSNTDLRRNFLRNLTKDF